MQHYAVFPHESGPNDLVCVSVKGHLRREELALRCERRARELAEAVGDSADTKGSECLNTMVMLLAAWSVGRVVGLGGRAVPLPEEAAAHDLTREPAGGLHSGPFLLPGEQPLLSVLTSGTTGQAKAHVKCARQLLGEATALAKLLPLGPADRLLSTVSAHHLYGLLFGILGPLNAGAQVVVDVAAAPGDFHPLRVAEVVRALGVTHLVTLPAHLKALLESRADVTGLREVISSAALLPSSWAHEFERHSGARVRDVLGSTETGGLGIRRSSVEALWTPLPGVRVKTDPSGHLLVTSPFLPDSGLAMSIGDRGDSCPDGRFLHTGRDDGIVKVGGRRLALQEVELAALSIPGVADASAFVRPTTRLRGGELWLVVAMSEEDTHGASATESGTRALRHELSTRLDPTFVPRRIRILSKLPRDERGKLPTVLLEHWFTHPAFEVLNWQAEPYRLRLRIRQKSPRFIGHFPELPLLPAVAQLLDVIVPEAERLLDLPVAVARRLKWLKVVKPGDELVLMMYRTEKPAGARRVRFCLQRASGEPVCTGALAAHGEP